MLHVFGTVFTAAVGILLRFIYPWSEESAAVAQIAPVGGSPGQKLKMLITPFLLWSLAEYVHGGQSAGRLLLINGIALLAGSLFLFSALLLAEKHSPADGRPSAPRDILLFLPAVGITFSLSYLLSFLWG